MADQNRSEELPVIRAYYELILWLMPKIGKFSREHRFTLGQRMEHLQYEILEDRLCVPSQLAPISTGIGALPLGPLTGNAVKDCFRQNTGDVKGIGD